MEHECGCRDSVPDWFFTWDCCGCRTRWLSTLPSRHWRQQVINQWRSSGEADMVDAVIAKLKEMANGK